MSEKSELEEGLINVLRPKPKKPRFVSGEEWEEWEPHMSASQRLFYYDDRKYILAHAERGSGKTLIALHKGLRHAYMYDDALVMIVVITKATATGGGCWDDLINESDFIDGPLKGTPAGILAMWKEGIGLEYGEPYEDGAHNKYIDIRNMHGGVSRIMLKSMPVAAQIQGRIKGQHPSFFLFEELTATFDPHYFTKPIQQLGRRRTVPAHAQQYVATCNPADQGKRHWVYEQFFRPDAGETEEEHALDFGVHHIPMSENEFMPDKEDYIKRVMRDCAWDSTAADRLIRGEWVEKMVGSALFEGFWIPDVHIRPANVPKGQGLMPFADELVTWGYDGGTVNNAFLMLQRSYVDGDWRWRVIDEVIYIDKRHDDNRLVHSVMNKMLFWNEKTGSNLPYEHISDDQARTHYNPSGSYTYREWAKISSRMSRTSEKYKGMPTIHMKCPPKTAGSVEERVKCIINKLAMEQLIVSPRCRKVTEMFNMLRRDRDRYGNDELFKPMKTYAGHIHIFDALSYPIYYYDLLVRNNDVNKSSKLKPRVMTFGG